MNTLPNSRRVFLQLYVNAGCVSKGANSFKDTDGTAEESLADGIRIASTLGSPTVSCCIGDCS